MADIQIGLPRLFEVGSLPFFELLSKWLLDCDQNHPDCGRWHTSTPCEPSLPTRLVDVGRRDDGDPALVHLRATKSPSGDRQALDDDDVRYIALSHPWGDGLEHDHFCTTAQNVASRLRDGIAFASLPATFQHAVQVTRALGIRYLWIDSLCIVQGKGGDFDVEAKCMEAVFSFAYCVIAAVRAQGSSSGFLWERRARAFVPLEMPPPRERTVYVCEAIDDFQHHVIEGSLSSRGWVLQERALARRTIYFAEAQTYWECGDGVRCETLTKMTK
jgi:hypothetical protein